MTVVVIILVLVITTSIVTADIAPFEWSYLSGPHPTITHGRAKSIGNAIIAEEVTSRDHLYDSSSMI
jgi:hypothetical protein